MSGIRFYKVTRAWLAEACVEDYEQVPGEILYQLYSDVLNYGSRKETVMLLKQHLISSIHDDHELADEVLNWYNAGRDSGLRCPEFSSQLDADGEDIAAVAYASPYAAKNANRLGNACMTLAHIIVYSGYELDDYSPALESLLLRWRARPRTPELGKLWNELNL